MMQHIVARVATTHLVLTLIGAATSSGSVTTIICHGYSLSGEKGPWVQTMCEAMQMRAIDEGTATAGAIVRYDQASGAWRLVSGTIDPNEPIFCIFRWLEDFDKPGPNIGYAEASSDAMYAALSDARFIDQLGDPIAGFDLVDDRDLHVVGHSRGTIVNSQVARRFAREGRTIDHVTSLDPHPVNGTLDVDPDWGDPVPERWDNIVFNDTYYRADGAFLLNALDVDGIPIPTSLNVELSETALSDGGYGFSHNDTHLWYHGTIDLSPEPCDGEQCITASMRASWWPEGFTERGYHYARLGGGVLERPTIEPGVRPVLPPVLFNGDFVGGMNAGWLFHGGALNASIVNLGGNGVLRFAPGNTLADHNQFILPAATIGISVDVQVTTADVGDVIDIALVDRDDVETSLLAIPADVTTPGSTTVTAPLGAIERDRAYRLRVRLVDMGDVINATVDVDNIVIIEGDSCPTDCAPTGGNGIVNIDDLLAIVNAFGGSGPACDVAPDNGDGTFGNGIVNIDDLLAVVNAFGDCP